LYRGEREGEEEDGEWGEGVVEGGGGGQECWVEGGGLEDR